MSESKKRLSPWVLTVILAAVAILFSFFALRSRSELEEVRQENQKLKDRADLCERIAKVAQQKADEAMQLAMAESTRANREAEECQKSNKRK